MAEIRVTTRLVEDYWRCYADTPNLGKVVVSQDRTPSRAQYRAAQCMDTNFPDDTVVWVDPYEGGSTDSSLIPSMYWDR